MSAGGIQRPIEAPLCNFSQLPAVCADCQPELWQNDSHCSAPMPGIIAICPLFPNSSPLFRHKYSESRGWQ